jgi:hypothetical protein
VTALPIFRNTRIGHFAPLLGVDDQEVYLANKNYPCISWFRGLPSYRAWVKREFHGFGKIPALEVPAYEISQVMQNTHLPALDLGSMRASLELRTPFLSRKLIETIAQFDPRVFLAFGQKVVLRNLLSRYLPPDTFQRSKVGFVFPRDQFLSHHGEAMPSVPGLPEEAVRSAWANRSEGRGWNQLAVRLVLASKFIENPSGSPILRKKARLWAEAHRSRT